MASSDQSNARKVATPLMVSRKWVLGVLDVLKIVGKTKRGLKLTTMDSWPLDPEDGVVGTYGGRIAGQCRGRPR